MMKRFKYDSSPEKVGSMETRIQDKGRITIPREIRKTLGIKEKDRFIIEVQGNRIVIMPKNSITVAQTFGIVKSKKNIKLEEIDEAAGKNMLS